MLKLSQYLIQILHDDGLAAVIRAGVLTVNGSAWFLRSAQPLVHLVHVATKHGWQAKAIDREWQRFYHSSQYVLLCGKISQ